MRIELSPMLRNAMRDGAHALREKAKRLHLSEQAKLDDQVGVILREAIDNSLFNSDILDGYLNRIEREEQS